MTNLKNRKIIIGLCGSIAAYKVAYLIRELRSLGAEIRVVMTKSAKNFISPLTIQALSSNEVREDLFDRKAEQGMGHIELARWADYLLIAPASANFLAKMAQGLADDLLSTVYLATRAPIVVCPAMNQAMWSHPATQANYKLLQTRGVSFVEPAEGEQACGDFGPGRLAETQTIINALKLYQLKDLLKGKKLLITAGPTREPIDPVRFLSNHSSGKMGYALAEAAVFAGAQVKLISGPCQLKIPQGLEFFSVETAEEMYATVMRELGEDFIFIGAAAVADYKPSAVAAQKLKKLQPDSPPSSIENYAKSLDLGLTLSRNPDILAAVSSAKKAYYLVGFAAETENVLQNAEAKLIQKNLHMVIANEVGEDDSGNKKGFHAEENKVSLLIRNKNGNTIQLIDLPQLPKLDLAAEIISRLACELKGSL